MKKSWKLIEKIVSQEKKIESRWYISQITPWNNIGSGDTVYFKNSGESVIARAKVDKVLQYKITSNAELATILRKYEQQICFATTGKKLIDSLKDKKYCILIFLKEAKYINPFKINKQGFGSASAWISVNSINQVKIVPKNNTKN